MMRVELKLKQASAVLGVPPKDLQNFVQAGVLKTRRRGAERRGVAQRSPNIVVQRLADVKAAVTRAKTERIEKDWVSIHRRSSG